MSFGAPSWRLLYFDRRLVSSPLLCGHLDALCLSPRWRRTALIEARATETIRETRIFAINPPRQRLAARQSQAAVRQLPLSRSCGYIAIARRDNLAIAVSANLQRLGLQDSLRLAERSFTLQTSSSRPKRRKASKRAFSDLPTIILVIISPCFLKQVAEAKHDLCAIDLLAMRHLVSLHKAVPIIVDPRFNALSPSGGNCGSAQPLLQCHFSAFARPAKKAWPSVPPRSGSVAFSGCGIKPSTVRLSLKMPAIARAEPLKFSVSSRLPSAAQ